MKKELAVLGEPKINHNLNLSMATSDLIELYIEENITRLEKEWEKLTVKEEESVNDKALTLVKKHLKSKLLFEVKSVEVYSNVKVKQNIEVELLSTPINSLDEAAKNRYLKLDKYYQNYGESQLRNLRIFGDNTLLDLDSKYVPEALLNAINSLFPSAEENKKNLIEKSRIAKRRWEIIQEYHEISNTRKVKAKFTKKALSNTTEGSKILEFLSQIDSIKALN